MGVDAVASRAGRERACLSPGERVQTSDISRVSPCLVSALHRWNEPADEAAPIADGG